MRMVNKSTEQQFPGSLGMICLQPEGQVMVAKPEDLSGHPLWHAIGEAVSPLRVSGPAASSGAPLAHPILDTPLWFRDSKDSWGRSSMGSSSDLLSHLSHMKSHVTQYLDQNLGPKVADPSQTACSLTRQCPPPLPPRPCQECLRGSIFRACIFVL